MAEVSPSPVTHMTVIPATDQVGDKLRRGVTGMGVAGSNSDLSSP